MAELWKDGFDHYGVGADGAAAMLQGPYAELNQASPNNATQPVIPSFDARTGNACMSVGLEDLSNSVSNVFRRVFPTILNEVFISFAVYLPTLPDVTNRLMLFGLQDNAGQPQ